jgi:hypothetical protein
MGIDIVIVVMLACPKMAWISDCCLLAAGRRQGSRREVES